MNSPNPIKLISIISIVVILGVALYLTYPESSKTDSYKSQSVKSKVEYEDKQKLSHIDENVKTGVKQDPAGQVVENNAEKKEESLDGLTKQTSQETAPKRALDLESNLNSLDAEYSFEKVDYAWSGYWENELNTIVLFAGSNSQIDKTNISCKSTICKVSVDFYNESPNDTVTGLSALSEQFKERNLKFAPESIDPSNGKVVFYTKPGEIN